MTQRSDRLQLVLEVAQRKEQKAMEALQACRQKLNQQEQQLDNLRDYQQQYLNGLKGAMQGRVALQNLQSYHRFVEQLSSAIEQQQQVVVHARYAFDQARQQWLECREKSSSLNDLVQRCRQEEARVREKQLEKRLEDDLNARRARSGA
ncbi:MAG: flagellar export protein FliJ [Oleiphilaceae bacterium]|nr:flagellar export protein FliJ [Oleiphilaceae bacterium]